TPSPRPALRAGDPGAPHTSCRPWETRGQRTASPAPQRVGRSSPTKAGAAGEGDHVGVALQEETATAPRMETAPRCSRAHPYLECAGRLRGPRGRDQST